MLEFIEAKNKIELVKDFFDANSIANTFRYYNTRSFYCIKNHFTTIIVREHLDNSFEDVGYGHIDYDSKEEKYWAGVCIIDSCQKKGYGKELMTYLLHQIYRDIDNKINTLWCTADKKNLRAIEIYKRFYNFEIDQELEDKYILKMKINDKERAQYQFNNIKNKKALVCTHLGLGDMINTISAIRYLSLKYDEVRVFCKRENIINMSLFYNDNPRIILVPLEKDQDPPTFKSKTYNGFDLYGCGEHLYNNLVSNENFYKNIPFSFYDDMGLNRNIIFNYFFINRSNSNLSILEYIKNELKVEKYYFVHDIYSKGQLDISEKLLENKDTLIINPNRIVYPENHRFRKINEQIQNKPLIFFINLMENANKAYLVDSSFLCLIHFLNLEKIDKVYYVSRDNKDYKSPIQKIVKLNLDEVI